MTLEGTLLGILLQTLWATGLGYLLNRRQTQLQRELDTQAARALEEFRVELARTGEEHRVRFTRFHEEQARVLAGIYERPEVVHGKLNALSSQIHVFAAYASFDPPTQSEIDGLSEDHFRLSRDVMKAYQDLDGYFRERAIWLDPDTERVVSEVSKAMIVAHAFTSLRTPIDPAMLEETSRTVAEHMSLISTALGLLRQRFRDVLTGGRKTSAAIEGDRDSNTEPRK